jgi:hypothetical protein
MYALPDELCRPTMQTSRSPCFSLFTAYHVSPCTIIYLQVPSFVSVPLRLVLHYSAPTTNTLQSEEWCTTNNKPSSFLLEARLAPDMHPLPFQVRVATNMARNVLLGPDWTFVTSGLKPDDENDFAGLQARIQRAIDAVQEGHG